MLNAYEMDNHVSIIPQAFQQRLGCAVQAHERKGEISLGQPITAVEDHHRQHQKKGNRNDSLIAVHRMHQIPHAVINAKEGQPIIADGTSQSHAGAAFTEPLNEQSQGHTVADGIQHIGGIHMCPFSGDHSPQPQAQHGTGNGISAVPETKCQHRIGQGGQVIGTVGQHIHKPGNEPPHGDAHHHQANECAVAHAPQSGNGSGAQQHRQHSKTHHAAKPSQRHGAK